MSQDTLPTPLLQGIDPHDFNIASLDDEIKVDGLCSRLIRHFQQTLNMADDADPLQIGEICHGADHFLREFIIGDRRSNLFEVDREQVRQFGGHWYIVRNLEPNMVELGNILAGTVVFYRFLATQGLISTEQADAIEQAAAESEFYQQRIESFWEIDKDGFDAWREACPLPPRPVDP